ncbi:MAG: HD domain-containing protein [Bacilli bacterium]
MKKQNWDEYNKIVETIINHKEFIKRKDYKHHNDISVYDHCLAVSKLSYLIAKKFNLNERNAAIAGLLHDFYFKPWQIKTEKKPFFKLHGFIHSKEALVNACRFFPELMNEEIANSILCHMFPLNISLPKYKVGWIVNFSDKLVSLEVLKSPKTLPHLVGLNLKKSKI